MIADAYINASVSDFISGELKEWKLTGHDSEEIEI